MNAGRSARLAALMGRRHKALSRGSEHGSLSRESPLPEVLRLARFARVQSVEEVQATGVLVRRETAAARAGPAPRLGRSTPSPRSPVSPGASSRAAP